MFLFFHDLICAMCTFSSSTNNFTHAQMLFRMSSLSGRMNIAWVNIECFTGCKKIKQRRISFVLGYLRMILWKISTAISIKHQILATFSIKIKFNSDSLYAFKYCTYGMLQSSWTMKILLMKPKFFLPSGLCMLYKQIRYTQLRDFFPVTVLCIKT